MSDPVQEAVDALVWTELTVHGRRLLMWLSGAKLNDHGDRWPERAAAAVGKDDTYTDRRPSNRPADTTAIRRALERRGLLQLNTMMLTERGHALARWAEASKAWPM